MASLHLMLEWGFFNYLYSNEGKFNMNLPSLFW